MKKNDSEQCEEKNDWKFFGVNGIITLISGIVGSFVVSPTIFIPIATIGGITSVISGVKYFS
jgi:uncharacterized membrane protein HdeD (DUF308 family)